MRFVIDSSWWRRSSSDGETLVAGSPLRVMRLTSRATALLDALEQGLDVSDHVGSNREGALIDRLVENGAIHPTPDDAADHRFHIADVTVVVPAHNERHHDLETLVRTLGDAKRVIIVDDGSTIPLAPVAGADVVRRDTAGGPGAARNTGLAMVDTELVLFVDADVSWETDAWTILLAHFDDERVAAVAPRVKSNPGSSLLARYESGSSPLDLGADPARVRARTRVSYVPAAAILVRVDSLRAVNGFDASLRYGEDVDLVWRLDEAGHTCRYEPRAVVFHQPRTTWMDAWRQRVSYGSAASALDERHPGAVTPLRINRWSATAWSLVGLGHVVIGVITGAWSTVMLVRKLGNVTDRVPIAMRLAGRGNLHAGRLIASALTRAWWPITLCACLVSRRARRMALIAAVVPNVATWLTARPDVDVLRYVAIRVADDVAYGTGVWKGALARRRAGALVPTLD